MKRTISLLLCGIMLVCGMFSAAAEGEKTVSSEYPAEDLNTPLEDTITTSTSPDGKLDIAAKSVILMEPYTGRILYENNPDEKLAPASITKIMSLLLVMEAIESGKMTLDTKVTASEHACSMGGSQIWLETGEVMTVNELLKAAVIASANDATVALGEAVAGSEEAFVQRMNERAKELGMNNTTFINCTGLDAEGHLTTAHDVALMSCALMKHKLIRNYSTVWMDSLRDGNSELVNTNKLVRFYPGTTGLKTGTTSTAGYCLSATAERDGLELCAVVMGGETSDDRFNGAKKMLDYGFANWAFTTVEADLSGVAPIPVKKGVQKTVTPIAQNTLQVLIPKGSQDRITQKVETVSEVAAPIVKGQSLGQVKVLLDEEEIGTIPLVSPDEIGKLNFATAFAWLLSSLFCL